MDTISAHRTLMIITYIFLKISEQGYFIETLTIHKNRDSTGSCISHIKNNSIQFYIALHVSKAI